VIATTVLEYADERSDRGLLLLIHVNVRTEYRRDALERGGHLAADALDPTGSARRRCSMAGHDLRADDPAPI
jgi:hypothetical protein